MWHFTRLPSSTEKFGTESNVPLDSREIRFGSHPLDVAFHPVAFVHREVRHREQRFLGQPRNPLRLSPLRCGISPGCLRPQRSSAPRATFPWTAEKSASALTP